MKNLKCYYNIIILFLLYRYLITGADFCDIAEPFRVGESTVREAVKKTCTIIVDVLSPIVLQHPATYSPEKYYDLLNGFWHRWNMPNCVGAIDGKHIKVKCPPCSGSMYYNYKGYFSVVLMAVCDANGKITS